LSRWRRTWCPQPSTAPRSSPGIAEQLRGDRFRCRRGHLSGQPTEFFIGAKTQREEYDVVCYAHAESGDTSIAWCRNSVWTTYSAIAQAVQANPTLGGVLLPDSGWIVAAGFDYTQTSDEDLNDPDVTTRFAHIDFRFTVSHLLQLS
jgi:hypothetical protein